MHMTKLKTFILSACAAALWCAGAAPAFADDAVEDAPDLSCLPDWSYEGDTGPEFWGDIGYPECSDGDSQTPVDLPMSPAPSDLPDLVLDYAEQAVKVKNKGVGIEYEIKPGSYAWLGGDQYELLQFHFHALSEHTVDNEYYDMELHLVHVSVDDPGQLMVIGMFIEEGPDDLPVLVDADWKKIPKKACETHEDEDALYNPEELVTSGPTYRYAGSLTTPPCSENVAWVVKAEPLVLSKKQIKTFTKLYPDNFRPIQPLNGRTIEFGE